MKFGDLRPMFHQCPNLKTPAEIRDDESVQAFVSAAESFQCALESRPNDRQEWVAALTQSLARLYAAGTALPDVDIETAQDVPDGFDVDDAEWLRLYTHVSDGLGNRCGYWACFDPTELLEPQEPVFGHLGDDLGDIYRDVIPGLRAWQDGEDSYVAAIVFGWKHPLFGCHWGVHAVSALRVLHELAYNRGVD